MAVFLVPIEDGRPIVLDKAIVLIGRQADCDVVLTNSRRVSRRHCCVAQVNDTFVVRDLGSMNGVRVNGRRIKSESPIKFGDVVSIGDLGFVLQGKDVLPDRWNPQQPAARGEPAHSPERGPQPMIPIDLSQDVPVAIPENEASLADDARDSAGFSEPDATGRPEPRPFAPQAPNSYDESDVDANDPEGADGEESPRRGYHGMNSHFELLPD